MKLSTKTTLLTSILVGSLVASAGALAGITTTKHNLGTTAGNPGANKLTSGGTGEICVFCHTPHGSVSGASVPLWNKTLPAENSYTTYDSLGTSTLEGGITEVGSVSIACLSCHDGSQAMDVMVNQPGSGGNISGDPNKRIGNTPVWGGTAAGDGKMGASFANLTADLTNDHPIGIQYGGGGITIDAPAATTRDVDFVAPLNVDINGTKVWYVDTNASSTRDKGDMQLYTRNPGTNWRNNDAVITGDQKAQPFVECASCHDPHVNNLTFLRISNDGSAVCLACHKK